MNFTSKKELTIISYQSLNCIHFWIHVEGLPSLCSSLQRMWQLGVNIDSYNMIWSSLYIVRYRASVISVYPQSHFKIAICFLKSKYCRKTSSAEKLFNGSLPQCHDQWQHNQCTVDSIVLKQHLEQGPRVQSTDQPHAYKASLVKTF